jgi:hypothetical protein
MQPITRKAANSNDYRVRSERRQYERKPLLVRVDCIAPEIRLTGSTLDISEGGLLISTQSLLEPNAVVEVRFELPVPPEVMVVQAKGIVVRSIPPNRTAIQFTDMAGFNSKAIRQYLKALAPMPAS